MSSASHTAGHAGHAASLTGGFITGKTIRIKAVYSHLDCLLTGIDRLKGAGITGFTVQAPLPRHEIEEIMYEGRPSPVRWWVLTGAIIGMMTGFALTSLTSAAWPMINPGGKPVVSIVPFTVILFECTILFGSLANFAGMMFHCGLPSFGLDRSLQDPRMTDASFGITFTEAPYAEREHILSLLNGTGAVEITTGNETFYEVPNA